MTTHSPTLSDADLRAILLTVDGKGRAAKEAALDELLERHRVLTLKTTTHAAAATFLREHAVMRWRAALPTVGGTYWWRAGTDADTTKSIVHVLRHEGQLLASPAADPHDLQPLNGPDWAIAGSQWAGPIEEPTS